MSINNSTISNINSSSTIPLLPPPPNKIGVTAQSKTGNKKSTENDFKAPLGEIQNTKNAKVYLLGDSEVASLEFNTADNFELRPRGKVNKPNNIHSRQEPQEIVFLEREIKDGDTLEKFALLYGCPMHELKQSNNISSNQDFYALRTIKIPVKKYGLLTESDEERRRLHRTPTESTVTSPTESFKSIHYSGESDDSDVIYRTLSIGGSIEEAEEGKKFLRNMDKDLERIVKKTQTHKDSLEEVASFLNGKSIHPLPFPKPDQQTTWSYPKTVALIVGIIFVSTFSVIFAIKLAKHLKDW